MSGVITLKDIITDEALTWGDTYVTNVDKAITQNGKLIESAKQLKAIYESLSKTGDMDNLVQSQKKASEASAQASKAYQDRAKALAEVDKERQRQMQNLLTTENRLQNVNSQTNVQLTQRRELLRQEQRAVAKNLTYMGQLEQKRYVALKQIEELNAKRALGIRLSKQDEQQLRSSTDAFTKYNNEFQKIKKDTKQFGFNVGNYPKGFEAIGGAIKKLLPGVGLLAGIKFGADFVKDAKEIANQAKGIEFAFKRLGDVGEDAFNRVKKATRGTLSDLDIKTALVDFDNFNISLEETDTLFEFLAVRASQTGKSVEELQSSLVEGLSKESKLRIDNLGISATELNKELEKTPNFVQAVANIAKREVAEAGDILDNAGTAQARWNAQLENFQAYLGGGALNKITDAMYNLGSNIIRAITPTKELTNAVREEQSGLNTLVGEILKTNEGTSERADLMDRLSENYPFFLKFLGREEDSTKDIKKALAEVNSLYIKRLALQQVTESLDLAGKQKKLAKETADLAQIERDYQKVLTDTNLYINRGTLDTDVASKSLREQNKALKSTIEFQLERLTQLRAQGKATDGQIKNIAKYQTALDNLAKATRVFGNANSQFDFAETAVEDVNRKVKELEEQLGITSENLEEVFDADPVVITVKLDPEAEAKARKELLDARFRLNKALLEAEIANKKELAENEDSDISNRLISNKEYFDKRLELLTLEKNNALRLAGDSATARKAIEAEYTNEVNALAKERIEANKALLTSSFEITKRNIEAEKKLNEEALNAKLEGLKAGLELELASADLTNEEKLKKVKEYEKAVADAKKEASIEALEAQKNAIYDALESEYLSFEQRKALEELLTAITKTQEDLRLGILIENVEEKKKQEEELKEFKLKMLQEFGTGLAEQLGIDATVLNDFIAGMVEGFDSALEGIQAGFRVVGEVANAIFDANIERIDEQMEATAEYYASQIELASGNERLQDELRKEAEKKRLELEAKKRKEQEKQAKYNKALAVVDIGIATALGIMQAYAQLGPIAGTVFAVIIGALGALQIATVLAKPIPKYEKGTDNHPGGFAQVAEKRPEWVHEPGKQPYRVTKPLVLPLAKRTKVYKSDLDYRRAMERKGFKEGLAMQSANLQTYEDSQAVAQDYSYELLLEMQANKKELQKFNKNYKAPKEPRPVDIPHELFKSKQVKW